MKGTFFSADFVKTDNGIKFLELNTDTTDVFNVLDNGLDYTGLISLLQSQSIDTFEVIYKPQFQKAIVNHISESIRDNASFITTWVEHEESADTIYPTSVSDASNKFILRMAYDENAVVDSVYAKHDVNSLSLFNEYTASSDCAPFYISSSDMVVDTLERKTNPGIYPDIVLKNQWSISTVSFLKVRGHRKDGEFVTGSNATHVKISGSYYNNATIVGTHGLVDGSFVSASEEVTGTHVLLGGRYEPLYWEDADTGEYNPNPDLQPKYVWVQGSIETGSQYDESRINDFVNNSELDSHVYYTNFLYGTGSIVDNHVTSLRHYGIVYGSELNHLPLGTVSGKSVLQLPTYADFDFTFTDDEHYTQKHYHEFSTSYIKERRVKRGIYETETLVSASGDLVDIEDVISGSIVKSFYIPNITDDEDLSAHFMNVSVSGPTLPANSSYTSSLVVSDPYTHEMTDHIIYELRVSGSDESNYMSTDVIALIYESSSNEFKFKNVVAINEDDHYFFDDNSNLIPILTSSVHILNVNTGSFHEIDVETEDNYVLANDTEGQVQTSLSAIVHNNKLKPAI